MKRARSIPNRSTIFNKGTFTDGLIKPFAKQAQLNVIPKTFHCNTSEVLAEITHQCKLDEEARLSGTVWGAKQVKDLCAHGFNNVHFYTVSAVSSVHEAMRQLV